MVTTMPTTTRATPARMALRAMKNFLSRRSIVTGRYRPRVACGEFSRGRRCHRRRALEHLGEYPLPSAAVTSRTAPRYSSTPTTGRGSRHWWQGGPSDCRCPRARGPAPRTRRAHVEFSRAWAVGGEVVELGIDHGSQLIETLGRRGGVNRHRAAQRTSRPRRRRYSSGPLLANLWTGDSTSHHQHLGGHGERIPIRAVQATGAPSLGEVHLLDRTRRDDLGTISGGGAARTGAHPRRRPRVRYRPGDLVVVDRADHGDHHVRPPVPAVVEPEPARRRSPARCRPCRALPNRADDPGTSSRRGRRGRHRRAYRRSRRAFENHLTFGVEFVSVNPGSTRTSSRVFRPKSSSQAEPERETRCTP